MTRLVIPKFQLVDYQSHNLLEQAATAEGDYQLLYYRDHDQFEVDLIVENAGGPLVGVEIKSAASVTAGDLRGLKRLASVAGDQFKMGVVLYDGTETLPLGKRLWEAPLRLVGAIHLGLSWKVNPSCWSVESSEESGAYGGHPTGCVGWIVAARLMKEQRIRHRTARPLRVGHEAVMANSASFPRSGREPGQTRGCC